VSGLLVTARGLGVIHRRRQVLRAVSFELRGGQVLGVVGRDGSGKTALLRTLLGGLRPSEGDIRINGRVPAHALSSTPVAYFAGDATLPGFVRAAAWGSLGTGECLTSDRRRLRALPRNARQLLGLRTELGRHPLALVLLDDPWDGLDDEGAQWLSATLEAKRDRGAGVIVSSRHVQHLAGLCDKYLFLTEYAPRLVNVQDLDPTGRPTARCLQDVLDRIRAEPVTPPRAPSLTLPDRA
jgi:ABC-2 type transport system ATP-binding protein